MADYQKIQQQSTLAFPLDSIDLTAALQSAPSFYQEVIDLRVGSHLDENDLRLKYLFVLAANLNGQICKTTNSAGPACSAVFTLTGASGSGSVDISTLASSCFIPSSLNVMNCVTALGNAESTAASDHRISVACGFARHNWMPTYTAIKRVFNALNSDARKIDTKTDFGASPGC